MNNIDEFLLKTIPNFIKTTTYGNSNADLAGYITNEKPLFRIRN